MSDEEVSEDPIHSADPPDADVGDPWAMEGRDEPAAGGWEDLGEHLLDEDDEPDAPLTEEPPRPDAAREPASEADDVDESVQAHAAAAPSAIAFSSAQVARARDLLTRMYALRRSAKFYPPEHPAVDESAQMLFEVVGRYHSEGVDVPLAFFEGEVFLGERFLAEDSVLFDQLVRDMTSIGAGSVTFRRGLTLDELRRALPLIGSDYADVKSAGGIEVIQAAVGTPHVVVGAVTVMDAVSRMDQIEDRELAKEVYGGALELMRELERVIRTNRSVSSSSVRGVVRSLVDNVLNNRYAMLELTGLRNHDEYTFYHSVNVAILSLALGSMVTNDYRFLSSLGVGALMHDIGKLAIDLEVLNKPGALTSEEWALVRQHPVYGAEVAAGMPGLDKASVVVILEHHMRHDLTGYPGRIPARKQHLASRIVAIADAYDAMTSRRSYSAARLQDEGMSLLARNADAAFDPALVRLFITLLGVYPPRSVVRLSTGETAVVTASNEHDVLRPHVRVISSPTGAMVEPFDVDLSDVRAAGGRTIARCLDPEGMNVDVEDFL